MSDRLAVIQHEQTVKELDEIEKKVKSLVSTFNILVETTDKVSNGLVKGTPKELIESLNKAQSSVKDFANIQTQITKVETDLANVRKILAKATLDEARAEEALSRIKHNETKTSAVRQQMSIREEQQRQKNIKALEKEQAKLHAAENTYNKVEAKLKTLQNEYKNLATRKEIGSKLTDEEIKRLNHLEQKIKKYDTTLKAVDATMGKYQRNVGNYASAFNPLSNSINQLTREAPAFANSIQTGFMAISNNLPAFFDALSQANAQNKQLRASGQATIPVWKQLTSSLFSWGTALSVGVTLLTLYGPELMKFVKSLFMGKEALVDMTKVTKDLNKAKQEGVKEAGNEITKLNLLYRTATNTNLSYKDRYKAVQNLQKQYPSYFGNMTAEQIMVGKAAGQYNKLKEAILQSAKARAMEKRLEAKEGERQEALEAVEQGERGWKKTLKYYENEGLKEEAETAKKALKNIENKRKAINKQYDEVTNLIADEIAKNKNENTASYESDTIKQVKIPNPKKEKSQESKAEKAKQDAIDRLNAERDNRLAELKERKITGEITEKAYWEGRINVIKNYSEKVKVLLNNSKNAELRKKAADEQEKAQKEIYDYEVKAQKSTFDNSIKPYSSQKNEVENNENISEVERVTKLQEINEELINKTKNYYDERIKLAKQYHQSEEEITNEASEKLQALEEEKVKLIKQTHTAMLADIEANSKLQQTLQGLSYEKQKAVVLADKTLSTTDKEYTLKVLELENQKKINEEKIKALKLTEQEYLLKGNLTKEEQDKLTQTQTEAVSLENNNASIDIQIDQAQLDNLLNKIQPIKDAITSGFKNLGLESISDEFNTMFNAIFANADAFGKKFESSSEKWKAIAQAGVSIIADFGKQLIQANLKEETAYLDEQLKRSQEITETELSFIDQRLQALNGLTTLTAEQEAERRALEDEAIVIKEQQADREKAILTQKARAEQRAQAQQALMNAALGATMTIAQLGIPWGLVGAAASIAFGALQAGIIMSKNPVPQYYIGTKNAPKGWAWTDERGAEIHTDKYGNIKDLGSNKGARLKYLEQGDRIYTATETRKFLENIKTPSLEEVLFAQPIKSIQVPFDMNTPVIDYDKLATKIGEQQERIARKYDKTNVYEVNGIIYAEKGGKIPQVIGRAKKSKNIIKIKGNERD